MPFNNRFSVCPTLFVLVAIGLLFPGCKKDSSNNPAAKDTDAPITESLVPTTAYEASGEQLLGARLDPELASEGWVRLFDGHTLFGWEITGNANWRIEDETLTVDKGERSLLCSSTDWKDYELTLEFNADEKTNSGVFCRTIIDPTDVELECYEVNIAPDDNPYPTGGIVKRQEVSKDAPEQSFGTWRRMTIRIEGPDVKVTVDDKVVCQYKDPGQTPGNRIALQHNSGRVAFRDIRIKRLGLESLLDKDLSQWKKYPKMPGEFTATKDGHLQVKGGRTQLESKESYDDFVLLADYKMADEKMNSGIFFRCIPGDEMMGYECQVSNQRKDGNPLIPADCGTGGIFKRQDARFVGGDPGEWSTVLLSVQGSHIAAWVNGVQVTDWVDDRKADKNPRRGQRLEAGTLMIQGHDPGTDAVFRQFKITSGLDKTDG
ncbi:3-keto-disaccharide hydrolase [Planctomycetes bacterium K23_9]|uniref:3-keto-alpha-glucoside-1,2-lyase/3-keto-2-hydroxy-glucal hydratase domain-containing protein n=1 Tax=Stieleria marina TaxID=1930275 RepID=A0A517NNZ1_9BACT|nr:hypothetical protein K239x_07650 [Planctomycetes bacterium K23_9]